MKFQITRIRLVSVGPEPARYDPLELDLCRPDQTGPADTVLFLPNTGGKTVLMRLLFSVLHPPIVERIGTEETSHQKKNLLGYVLDRDTAHVVIEWRRVESGRFADDQVLVTGLVAEWREARRPADPKPEDLKRLWYSIRGSAGMVGVNHLAFEIDSSSDNGPVRRRLPLRRFREQLEELRKSGQRAKLEVSTTEVQRDWVDHLDKLGLDRALFRYQGEMNHNEAGASAIARFREDRDFIKFFLDAVFDPVELAALDREFDEVANKVRRLPEYERRLRFEQAALTELGPLVELIAALAAARSDAQAARTSAMTLLSAFVQAEVVARTREQTERQRSRDQDAEARRLTVAADRFRDEWREFRRLAASFWRDDAAAEYENALKGMEAANLDAQAWSLTEDLARYGEAVAKVKALDAAYAAEMERLRPLQTSRDDAATRLARALSANVVLAAEEVTAARVRSNEAKKRATTARNEERDAHIEAAKLDVARQDNERRIAEVAAMRDRLVAKGFLTLNEPAEEARDREVTAAARASAQVGAIERDIEALDEERNQLDEFDRNESPRVGDLTRDHARLAGEIERAEQERLQLCAHPLVIELAEAVTFDLELVGGAIAERLLGYAKEADATRLTIELQGADDQRAVRGLEETGYLPPSPEVDAALARLTAAGITGAVPGARYAAEAIATDRRGSVLASRADLIGGIVLVESLDVAKARSVLDTASLNPAMIIAVGPAAELVAAERDDRNRSTFVIPPSEAIWDRAAAGEERARREERLASLEQQRGTLEERSARARSLAEALVRHATAHPVGWLSMRVAERDGLGTEMARLNQLRLEREERRSKIAELLRAFRTQLTDLRRVGRESELRAAEIERFVEQEVSVAGFESAIERLRADAKNWRILAEEAARSAKAADEDSDRETAVAQDHRVAGERIQQELSTIVLGEPVRKPSAQEAKEIVIGSDNLFELRATFAELDRRLTSQTSSSDVATRRGISIEERDKLSAAIDPHPEAVRVRARDLLTLPDAGDIAGRRAATERATIEAARTRTVEREAYLEKDNAQAELLGIEEEIRSSRRSAKIASERLPHDRHQAAVYAAEARQSADHAQGQVAAAERERNLARDAAEAAKTLVDALKVLATQLRMSLKLGDTTGLPTAEPFAGDVDEANSTGLAMAQRLTNSVDSEREAEQAWRDRDSAVRALLAKEEFADLAVSDHLYRRLAQSPAEALARDAAELVTELRACIGVLQAELATLEQDRKLATTSLAKSVNKALSYLRLAETRSKMPPRLRDWSGESFIEVRFEKPPAEELDVRLRTFVIEILDPKADRPSGSKLLMLALHRAVGEFRVKILKPNEAFAPIRVPIAELSSPKFSNGQRATVATAMMLMLSELRRQSRSAARDASVGTLILDNPLGNANAGFLIEVQRTVAAAAGIQLIYTTGISDFSALRRFSNVIALSNDAARRTMRRYVRTNPELLELLAPKTHDSGGHLSARRVVAVADREKNAS